MIQHMAMMMIVPPLWVLGGPVTLLSRAVPPRTDGSRGVREWVLAALHTGYSRLISSPPLAGFIFVGSLILFYFSPLFEMAMRHHLGHVLMTVHFLGSGYLFAWVLIGIDPSQRPINPVLKLITLLITLAFHAFFGVAMVSATWLVAEDWYTQLGMYGLDRLELIQVRGGTIMWAISEIPTVGYAIIVAAMWMKSDDRRARQYSTARRNGTAAPSSRPTTPIWRSCGARATRSRWSRWATEGSGVASTVESDVEPDVPSIADADEAGAAECEDAAEGEAVRPPAEQGTPPRTVRGSHEPRCVGSGPPLQPHDARRGSGHRGHVEVPGALQLL